MEPHHGGDDGVRRRTLLQHRDILPDSDRRDLDDNNYSARGEVILLIHIKTTHIITSLLPEVPDVCPNILSPKTILIIRWYHSSWASPSGVILLGGGSNSGRTSERIQEDGTSVSGFPLEYDIGYNMR